ncbi:riboflavin biosynthesis protein PYRR, chloroplastic [Tanacetum coccineum]
MLENCIIEIQKVIHTVKIDKVRQIVDVESFGKSADEIDKETVSFGEMQLKQVDRSCVYASIELHLHVIHVVPIANSCDTEKLQIREVLRVANSCDTEKLQIREAVSEVAVYIRGVQNMRDLRLEPGDMAKERIHRVDGGESRNMISRQAGDAMQLNLTLTLSINMKGKQTNEDLSDDYYVESIKFGSMRTQSVIQNFGVSHDSTVRHGLNGGNDDQELQPAREYTATGLALKTKEFHVHAFVAPKIIGGKNAPSPVGELRMVEMPQALELIDVSYEQIGADVLISGYLQPIPDLTPVIPSVDETSAIDPSLSPYDSPTIFFY